MAIPTASFMADFNQALPHLDTPTGRRKLYDLIESLVVQANVGSAAVVSDGSTPAAQQLITDDGANVSVDTQYTLLRETNGSANGITLPDWAAGKHSVKVILCTAVTTGSVVITPATLSGGTTITFDAVGEFVVLHWVAGSGWVIVANYNQATGSFTGATVA